MQVLHITTGLNDGGAEAMLYRLCINDLSNQHVVISLMDSGKYGPMLRERGIPVYTLDLERHQITISALIKLFFLVRSHRECVVQTWMYHADLLGGVVAYFNGVKKIVWGIHNTVLEPGISARTTIWIAKLLAKLSWWLPDSIIVCSNRSIEVHRELGYDPSKMKFVPNGYDISMFYPDETNCSDYLSPVSLLGRGRPIIGVVGRHDPYKDHDNLFAALSLLKDRDVPFFCLLVGKGMDDENPVVREKVRALGLLDSVALLGQRNDIAKIMNVLDMHVLSSSAEAFPNVVCEAMACGTPCVVTDVGDASHIVGDTGWVVPPKNPVALADAIEKAIDELKSSTWVERCRLSRQRIEDNFSIGKVVGMYSDVWTSFHSIAASES